MKTLFLLLGICFFLFQSNYAQTTGIKINSYAIDAKVVKNSENVDVKLLCNLTANDNLNASQFIFSSAAKIKAITCLKGKLWVNIPYKVNGRDSLMLKAKGLFAKDKNYSLKFTYTFPAGKLNDTLLMLDRGHRWYPLIMDQIMPFKLTCEVPAGYNVLSAGNLISKKEGRKNIFIWESKMPVFKIPIIVFNPDKFKKESNRFADIYWYSADPAKVKEILAKIERIMTYNTSIMGDYSFSKLTLIEVQEFPGVNVCSGLLMVGSQSLDAICRGDDDSLTLPVAQQWFAAGVFAQYGGKGFFFMTISLPHYIKLMYIRHSMGEEAYKKAMLEPLAGYKEFAGKEKDISLIDIDAPNTREKGLILYGKGPHIISKIENEMGKEQFECLMKTLYSQFKGKILTFDEFEKYLAKDDERGNVLTLFRSLMSTKGMPEE